MTTSANESSSDGDQPESQKSTSEALAALRRRAQKNQHEAEEKKLKFGEEKSISMMLVEEATTVRPAVARYVIWSFLGSLLFFLVTIAANGISPSHINERIVDQAFKLVQLVLPLMTLILGFYFGKSNL